MSKELPCIKFDEKAMALQTRKKLLSESEASAYFTNCSSSALTSDSLSINNVSKVFRYLTRNTWPVYR